MLASVQLVKDLGASDEEGHARPYDGDVGRSGVDRKVPHLPLAELQH